MDWPEVIRSIQASRELLNALWNQNSGAVAAGIELKWDQSAEGAIEQIRRQQYIQSLKDYHGNLLLVGINYDRKAKKHSCKIEKLVYPIG